MSPEFSELVLKTISILLSGINQIKATRTNILPVIQELNMRLKPKHKGLVIFYHFISENYIYNLKKACYSKPDSTNTIISSF